MATANVDGLLSKNANDLVKELEVSHERWSLFKEAEQTQL
jgi:hypothetical protein